MLLACVLAIGFMVWFLIGLLRDDARKGTLRLPLRVRAPWKPESVPVATWRWLRPDHFLGAATSFFGADSESEHLSR